MATSSPSAGGASPQDRAKPWTIARLAPYENGLERVRKQQKQQRVPKLTSLDESAVGEPAGESPRVGRERFAFLPGTREPVQHRQDDEAQLAPPMRQVPRAGVRASRQNIVVERPVILGKPRSGPFPDPGDLVTLRFPE